MHANMHGVAVATMDAVTMHLSTTIAHVDACETMVNADVFTSFVGHSFRSNMHALDAPAKASARHALDTPRVCAACTGTSWTRGAKRLGNMSRPDVSRRLHDAIHDKSSGALSHVDTQEAVLHSSVALHLRVLRNNAKPF